MEKYSSKKPFKRAFSKFKKRRTGYGMYKAPKVHELTIKAEFYDTVFFSAVTAVPLFQNTGRTYIGLREILVAAVSFQNEYSHWGKYMITGATVDLIPCSDLAHLRSIFSLASPGICCAFYPNVSTTNLGDIVRDNDNLLVAYGAVPLYQRKSWKFPKNYMTGAGTGIGTWNSTLSHSNQDGQFSICNLETGNVSSANANVFNIRINVYVKLGAKNQ